MANPYENVLIKVLRENPDELTDSEALQSTLDQGTDPTSFDVDAQAAQDHMNAISAMQDKMVHQLTAWIGELERFSKFLNGTDPSSMQSKLSKAVPDTLFDKIRVAETKKIARVSMEIASLCEIYKGYLATSSDPKLKGV